MAVSIALVVGIVIGAMYLLDIPLTLLTTFLVGLLVLPSMLWLWDCYAPATVTSNEQTTAAEPVPQD